MTNSGNEKDTPSIKQLAQTRNNDTISSAQDTLDLGIELAKDIGGIGLGVLSDGTPYLNQRGLATMCGVENAHIGTISSQWNDETEKPRIRAIKAALSESGSSYSQAHIEVLHKGVVHYCYPAEVCLAVLEYYAFDAGQNLQPKARKNFRLLAGSKLSDMIYSQVGYDPDGNITEPLRKWFERIELNHQSAGDGYFCIFNESHTVIYELIMAGAPIGESMVPDISMGTHWARYWEEFNLDERFGEKKKFPHRYPNDHPQAKSNPQSANCYPVDALGEFRRWLNDVYIGEGKFAKHLKGQKKIPPSVAQLAIERLSPKSVKD